MSYDTLRMKVEQLIEKAQNSSGGTEELENLIDQSGVLDSTDGSVTEKVEQLIEKAEDENLWYGHFNNPTRSERLFFGYSFPKLPKLPVLKPSTMAYYFSEMTLETIDNYIDVAPTTTIAMNAIFAGCSKLVSIAGINTLMCKDARSMFSACKKLETIQEPLNFSNITNLDSVFYGCLALKNIRFVPETIKKPIAIPSPVLSDESIESILKGLAPVETIQNLSLHATVWNKLFEDKFMPLWDEAIDKNWEII